MDPLGTDWQARARRQFDAVLEQIDGDLEAERKALDRAVAESAVNRATETLNQGLRRLRGTATLEEAACLAHELAGPYAARGAVFLFQDARGIAKAARGLGPLPLVFSPDEGAAFRAAVETRDPVIAMGAESEISPALAARVGGDGVERVYLFPLAVRTEVRAILFAAGNVAFAPMELIAGMAAVQMEALTAPASQSRADLVAIRGAEPERARQTWTDLPPDLQALHLKAQRDARLRVAEMRLEHGEALRRGIQRSAVYESLREPIDAARSAFRRNYVDVSPSMVDYLYLELVRGLAQDNDQLLGPSFPGPLV